MVSRSFSCIACTSHGGFIRSGAAEAVCRMWATTTAPTPAHVHAAWRRSCEAGKLATYSEPLYLLKQNPSCLGAGEAFTLVAK